MKKCTLFYSKLSFFLQKWYGWIIPKKINIYRSCLKQKFATFIPNNLVNLFVLYELDIWSQYLNTEFNLNDCLIWAVKLTKYANPNKYS